MAFVRKNLERVGGAIRKLYVYNAGADTVATVLGAGYIADQDVANNIDAGDVIMCVANNNGTIDNLIVTSARGTSPLVLSAVEGVTTT